jgi:hypothetical protein
MEDLEMMALQGMMGPEMGGAPPMDPMMDPMAGGVDPNADPMGVTDLPVPNFAVPAVIELISLLEQTVMSESGGMPDPMADPMAGMGGGMMDF